MILMCWLFFSHSFKALPSRPSEFVLDFCLAQNSYGIVNVAPVFTIKDYHSKTHDMEKLRNNLLGGLIYLEEGEYNKSSFITLTESFPVYINLLKPIRLELSAEYKHVR